MAGLGGWQIAAATIAALLILQVGVVLYVAAAAFAGGPAKRRHANGAADRYAVILPK